MTAELEINSIAYCINRLERRLREAEGLAHGLRAAIDVLTEIEGMRLVEDRRNAVELSAIKDRAHSKE